MPQAATYDVHSPSTAWKGTTMDRLYPNFHSLHAAPAEPLEPRFKRRSWNTFPENSPMPYSLYASIQDTTLQTQRRQRCSSEAPASRRVSTFLPDRTVNQEQEVDDNLMDNTLDEPPSSISPILPIAVVKPTFGRMDGSRRIHRPQPCYGVSIASDLPPPCMQMSTPEVYFTSNMGFKQPASSLPRRRIQMRRERPLPVVRHSVFEYPNVIDYGPLQDNELTLRRRARRHPETINTAPISRRRPFRNEGGLHQMQVPNGTSDQAISREEGQSNIMIMSNSLPPMCVYSGRLRKSNRERVNLNKIKMLKPT